MILTISEIVMIMAVFLGPIMAVQIQKYLESRRERTKRKLYIFQSLMATRSARLSPLHVEALNRIDTEFYGDKSARMVLEAWKGYLDHLDSYRQYDENKRLWAEKREDLFVDLLYEMGNCLGYHFDKVYLKKGFYIPSAHAEQEQAFISIRDGLRDILDGKRSFPVDFTADPETLKSQREMQEKWKDLLDGKIPLRMKIDKD